MKKQKTSDDFIEESLEQAEKTTIMFRKLIANLYDLEKGLITSLDFKSKDQPTSTILIINTLRYILGYPVLYPGRKDKMKKCKICKKVYPKLPWIEEEHGDGKCNV